MTLAAVVKRDRYWLLASAAVLAILLVQVVPTLFRPLLGDEGIYLKGADLLLQGIWPYEGYFLAHPPLRTLVGAAAGYLTGEAWGGRLVSLFCVLGTAVFAGLAVGRFERRAGYLTVILWLASGFVRERAVRYMGSDLALLGVSAGLWLLASARPLFGGIAFAVGGFGALFGLVAVPGAGLSLLKRPKELLSFSAGLAFLPILYVLVWSIAGESFVRDTLLFHVAKTELPPGEFPSRGEVFWNYFEREWVWLLLALTGFANFRNVLWRICMVLAICSFGAVLAYSSIHIHYFQVPHLLLVGAAASGVSGLLELAAGHGRRVLLAVVAVLAVVAGPTVVDEAGRFPRRMASWERGADVMEEMADWVKGVAGGASLAGDSSLVPALSLETGLAVAGNVLDMNAKRFMTGGYSIGQFAQDMARYMVEANATVVIVTLASHGFGNVDGVAEWIDANCQVVGQRDFQGIGTVRLAVIKP